MALRTYQFTAKTQIGNFNVSIKAKKDVAENVSFELSKIGNLRNWRKELTGVKGKDERSSIYWECFGSFTGEIENAEQWENAVKDFFATLPVLTPENIAEYRRKAEGIFDCFIPVVDNRVTAEERANIVEENNKRQAEELAKQEEENAAYLAKFSNGEIYKLQEGEIPVLIKTTYDDSHMMSDYYSPHKRFGYTLLLGIVNTKTQREETLRRIMERYPDLAKFNWTFHREEYSMGHGTYLESEYIEIDAEGVTSYGGVENPGLSYEISMNKHAKPGTEYYCFKNYPGNDTAEIAETEKPTISGDAQIIRNEAKNGIEIHFNAKPDPVILDELKANGWRWSRFNKCWYQKYSEWNEKFAKTVLTLLAQ